MVWVTQLVFYGLPWLQWNDRQAVLFDLVRTALFMSLGWFCIRRISSIWRYCSSLPRWHSFSSPRLPGDYGAATPVHKRSIQRYSSGWSAAQKGIDRHACAWMLRLGTCKRWCARGSKQLVWIAIALVTGLTFVGYFSSIQGLLSELLHFAFSPWEWFWILFYSLATYGNAGFLREQICKHMCPYARFQSALIDMDSHGDRLRRTTRRGPRLTPRAVPDPAALGLGPLY
jgi:hypothetical protein